MKTLVCALVLAILAPAAAWCQNCSVTLPYRDTTFYESDIRITSNNFPDDAAISAASDFWNQGCQDAGYSPAGFYTPTLSSGTCTGSGCIQIWINYVTGTSQNSQGSCGQYQDNQSGQSTGGTITIYEYDSTGRPCSSEWLYTLEHELGHVLGLDHPSNGAHFGDPCFDHVMATHTYATPYASVGYDDCHNAEREWYTPAEEQADQNWQQYQECGMSCWTSCSSSGGGYSCPPWNNGESPIIIDLDDEGFELTGASDGVFFDLNADGIRERTAWTAAGPRNAFLCRDRNHDGRIGDGRELFGNNTPLANGHKAPNGFLALAEYDTVVLGGNGDGMLDSRDAVWSSLRLWIDRNHDGVSQPSELISMAGGGVASIDLAFTRSNYQDIHGNLFRFRGTARVRNEKGKYHPSRIYDVFLLKTAASLR